MRARFQVGELERQLGRTTAPVVEQQKEQKEQKDKDKKDKEKKDKKATTPPAAAPIKADEKPKKPEEPPKRKSDDAWVNASTESADDSYQPRCVQN